MAAGSTVTTHRPMLIPVTEDGLKVPVEIENVTLTVDTTGLASSAKQDTGNTSLASIKTDVDNIPAKGTAAMAGSTPVTIATDDTMVSKLTQPTKTTTVTPSDATDTTTTASKGFWVGVGGDVAVRGTADASATTLKNVPSGAYVPGAYQRIMSTNTTATNIVSFA